MAPIDLDVGVWDRTLGQLCRFHWGIQKEVKELIATIRASMDESLVPKAEERANFGKEVKQAIREMWALEYEIEDLQTEFVKSLGGLDLDNLTDDIVEDIMLQSKPLQAVLLNIRGRQQERMDAVKKIYETQINELEPLAQKRPPKAEEEARLKRREEAMKQEQQKKVEENDKTQQEKKSEENKDGNQEDNQENKEDNQENKDGNEETKEGNEENSKVDNEETKEDPKVEVPSIAVDEAPQEATTNV